MNSKLYLECYAGISGDMFVASLLDLGADRTVLDKALQSLDVPGFTIEVSRVIKSGIDACDFYVKLDKEYENHDHDMKYLHGQESAKEHIHAHEHMHEHTHTHEQEHMQEHTHTHEQEHMQEHAHTHEQEPMHEHTHTHEQEHMHEHAHSHEHEHRGLQEITEIIRGADMSARAKETANAIFGILAKAEAKAHGTTPNEVHFHEVGAVDSIVDVIAAAVCLDSLNITEVVVPVLYEGCGYVRCMHGFMPIPVPAVANIAAACGLKLHMTDSQGEFVTPTGAAIAAAICTSQQLPEDYKIESIGVGAGKRSYERPSLLRAMLISESADNRDIIYKLECNIDDCTGEALGFAMERLLAAGARDVHYFPVYMKKNRPAYQLNVICTAEKVKCLEEIIFAETTTIGIRRQRMERSILTREMKNIQTSLGEVTVKICTLPNGKRCYPEYESIAGISRKTGKPFIEVCEMVTRECSLFI